MLNNLLSNAEAFLGSLVHTQVNPAPNEEHVCPVLTVIHHPEAVAVRVRSLFEAIADHPISTMAFASVAIGVVVGAVVVHRRYRGTIEWSLQWVKTHESFAFTAACMLLLLVGFLSANKLLVALALFAHAVEGITHNPLAMTIAVGGMLFMRKSARKAARWAKNNKVAATFALTVILIVAVHIR